MMKIILITFASSVLLTCIIFNLLFTQILSVYGLKTLTLDELSDLNKSKVILEKVKKKHQLKKLNIHKKYTKKISKKVSSTAVAAATLGTIAVIATSTWLEITEYCDTQRTLQEEENLLFSKNKSFNYNECISQAKSDSYTIMNEVKNNIHDDSSILLYKIKKFSIESWDDIKISTSDSMDDLYEHINKLWKSIDSWI